MGGVTELCKVFQVAAARGVTVMPHTFYHGPGLLAAVHVTAALGTADSMIEWRHTDLQARATARRCCPSTAGSRCRRARARRRPRPGGAPPLPQRVAAALVVTRQLRSRRHPSPCRDPVPRAARRRPAAGRVTRRFRRQPRPVPARPGLPARGERRSSAPGSRPRSARWPRAVPRAPTPGYTAPNSSLSSRMGTPLTTARFTASLGRASTSRGPPGPCTTTQARRGVAQPGDPHFGDPGPGRLDQPGRQLVGERARRLDRLQRQRQRRRLGGPDPDGQRAVTAALGQDHDVLALLRVLLLGAPDLRDLGPRPIPPCPSFCPVPSVTVCSSGSLFP